MNLRFNKLSFLVELFCAVLLGIIPSLWILYQSGTVSVFDHWIDVFTDNNKLFWIALIIAIFSIVLEKNKTNILSSLRFSYTVRFVISECFDRVGMTVLGIYRSMAGALFILGLVIMFQEWSLYSFTVILPLYGFALACLWFTTALQKINFEKRGPFD